jgi:hypothetical protein
MATEYRSKFYLFFRSPSVVQCYEDPWLHMDEIIAELKKQKPRPGVVIYNYYYDLEAVYWIALQYYMTHISHSLVDNLTVPPREGVLSLDDLRAKLDKLEGLADKYFDRRSSARQCVLAPSGLDDRGDHPLLRGRLQTLGLLDEVCIPQLDSLFVATTLQEAYVDLEAQEQTESPFWADDCFSSGPYNHIQKILSDLAEVYPGKSTKAISTRKARECLVDQQRTPSHRDM